MKQALCSLCAIALLMLVSGACYSVMSQTATPTPDPFVIQLTSSPAGGANAFSSFASDISANGRFVVFESNGDVATQNRNNADGNREIFLADYAQRRIFQLTNTKNVQKPPASPSPTPTPTASPSPTPTPSPTPADPSQVQIEISSNRPMISAEPALVGGKRVYTIVFSTNSPTLPNFDGTDPSGTLAADGNQEIWIYQLPAVTDVDLSSGDDLPPQDLAAGTFTQVTSTPASRVPSAGASGVFPFVADDNREAAISDDGIILAFISTRDLVSTVGNTDGNPELFFRDLTTAPGTFIQATNTSDDIVGPKIFSRFQQNPSLSANGSRVAFLSSANLTGNNDDDGSGHGNAEVYMADFTGSGLSNIRQVTKTKAVPGGTVNLLSPGRRLSRDGALIALESLADDPKANTTPTQSSFAIFVYNIAADSFAQVGPRAIGGADFGFIHFPAFTDYDSSLAPSTVVFASALNFKPDGTFPAADQASTGLNPQNQPQLFSTQVPVTSTNTFARLTKNPVGGFGGIRALTSQTRTRMTFSLAGSELGGGNPDLSSEIYYLLLPVATSESTAPLSFFTGASEIPLPNPSPSPSPSVGTVTGVAPGELAIVRSTDAFAGADLTASGTSETTRSPALPVELGGVSVAVNGAAAGLYFVGGSSKQINFVVPLGITNGIASVVVNKADGTRFRGSVIIVPAQPDIFTIPVNRAVVFNVTNPMTRTTEPFNVTSTDSGGNTVPTVLEINLTGARFAVASEVKVTIVTTSGNTDITGTSIVFVGPNKEMPGLDLINFTLPASLAGAGDVPIIVTVTKSGTALSSRPADTAPHIIIN